MTDHRANSEIVWVRGAGEVGSAIATILQRVGFRVFLSEISPPLAIRRSVTFSDAVLNGSASVEGVNAHLCRPRKSDLVRLWDQSVIPIMIDDLKVCLTLGPDVLVDARMLKDKSERIRRQAAFTIGMGPGFEVPEMCDLVIETNRGHNLGKLITQGRTEPDTGTPGALGGESSRRVLYSPGGGRIEWLVEFGDLVTQDEILGRLSDGQNICAPFGGLVRGLISPHVQVTVGLKIADLDPRGAVIDILSVSDKSRSLGRAVLEAILVHRRSSEIK